VATDSFLCDLLPVPQTHKANMIHISHKRNDCIGCGACVDIAPNYWTMADDGLASLLEVQKRHGSMEFGKGFQHDKELLQESADSCPVDIIKIT